MPESATLEETAAAAKSMGDYIKTVNEVVDYQIYVGTASPFNFNGLVRHYYLRQGPFMADIQVNQEKAALNGIPSVRIVETLTMNLSGIKTGLLHHSLEKVGWFHFPGACHFIDGRRGCVAPLFQDDRADPLLSR